MQYTTLLFATLASLALAAPSTSQTSNSVVPECCDLGPISGSCCTDGYTCGCPKCECKDGEARLFMGTGPDVPSGRNNGTHFENGASLNEYVRWVMYNKQQQ